MNQTYFLSSSSSLRCRSNTSRALRWSSSRLRSCGNPNKDMVMNSLWKMVRHSLIIKMSPCQTPTLTVFNSTTVYTSILWCAWLMCRCYCLCFLPFTWRVHVYEFAIEREFGHHQDIFLVHFITWPLKNPCIFVSLHMAQCILLDGCQFYGSIYMESCMTLPSPLSTVTFYI